MIKSRRTAVMAATALALSLAALAAPASAAMADAAHGTQATAHAAGPLNDQAVSPNAFTSCSINAFGNYGSYICQTQPLILSDFLGGEAYVIGTNWAIWETTAISSGWFSLGGVAQHKTGNAVNVWTYSPNFTIWTWGTDGQQWCDEDRGMLHGGWSGWYRCAE